MVKDQLFDLLDDSARVLFDNSDRLTAQDATFWYRLFSGIRPESSELLPDLSKVAPHCALLDLRLCQVSPGATAAFRSKAKEAAIDDVYLSGRTNCFATFLGWWCFRSRSSICLVPPRNSQILSSRTRSSRRSVSLGSCLEGSLSTLLLCILIVFTIARCARLLHSV